MSNMKAVQLVARRIAYSAEAFAEIVIWKLPKRVSGSNHDYKYHLAYIADGTCVIRYDNETGKGDHRHFKNNERIYVFETLDKLLADFELDIARWNDENRDS